MNGQLELARPDRHPVEDVPPVRRTLVQRFGDWADPEVGGVGTAGAVARAVVCVLLCLLATLVIVGALTGLVVAIGSIA
ncbi:MAG TPA: hypothetical protein VKX24_09530 [Acidimicrobiia bacterium]|nr:hypothetical protein [Acidimicrobiia bacterium]HZQ75867.1 hypothetical protein [Acidimicrobiia bacterium]